MALQKLDMNAREAVACDHQEEYERLRYSVAMRLRLNPEDQNVKWILDELYELGYDQGSTMEASFPSD